MKIAILPILLLALLAASSCRDAGEFMGFTGSPEGTGGWAEDYNSTPADVWEAFRAVVRDNGTIIEEKPDEMYIRGEYKPHDSKERDGIQMRGTVYDKSTETEVRTRLIVHAWYHRSVDDRERPHTAREYCNTVYRVLQQWKGGEVEKDSSITTTSDEPIREDEGVGYFKLTTEQVHKASLTVLRKYGSIEQDDGPGGFIRAIKENALETTKDDVRVNIYNRDEEGVVRTKISVRVRSGNKNEPLQEIARSYVAEIRKELEKAHGPQE